MSLVNIAGDYSTSRLLGVMSEDVQPNAVDLRLDRIFTMSRELVLSEETKLHREKTEIFPDKGDWFTLGVGSYEISFINMITVGEDEAGFVITRSTLNRNGVFITSGLYDSGYGSDSPAPMAGCLHVNGGPLKIQRGTRVGQYLSWKAQALSSYQGSYGKRGEGDAHLY